MFVRLRAVHEGCVGPFVTCVDHIRSDGALAHWEFEVAGDHAEANSSDRAVFATGRQDRPGAHDDR